MWVQWRTLGRLGKGMGMETTPEKNTRIRVDL
jgi:hypothetical protein